MTQEVGFSRVKEQPLENDRPKTHSEMIEDELGRPHTVKSAGVREYVLGAQRRGEEIAGLVADLTALEGKRALDVGTGDGGAALAFSRRGCRVTAFDNSWDNVRRARQLARETSATPMFLVMDAEFAAFAPETFDVVILADLLEHVAGPARVVESIANGMKRGALCYVTVPNRFSPWNVFREQHYRLFGLSLMPRRIASFYVTRVRKRSTIYAVEAGFSWRSLRKLFATYRIVLELCGEFRSLDRLDKPELLIDPAQRFIVKVASALHLIPLLRALLRTQFYKKYLAPALVCVGRKTLKDGHDMS